MASSNPTQAPVTNRLPHVANVVCVASGKGGVGKSTVASNLALALAQDGQRVGLLDADIYGPSMPTMLGMVDARPTASADGKGIAPIIAHGIKVMSMGFMMNTDDAVVWRGPMLGKALQQFIEDVDWGELDVLVLDMPPGTGDVQLSLAQLLPVSGAVVVTTPQDVAFADVRRALKMLSNTRTPILGLVENMSHFVCDGCGKEHRLFGASQIEDHAKEHNLEVLVKIPLDSVTAVSADAGQPIVVAQPDSDPARLYRDLAQTVLTALRASAPEPKPEEKFSSFFKMKS
jgi:ATP-binding protein involved in chromosome partitioning